MLATVSEDNHPLFHYSEYKSANRDTIILFWNSRDSSRPPECMHEKQFSPDALPPAHIFSGIEIRWSVILQRARMVVLLRKHITFLAHAIFAADRYR